MLVIAQFSFRCRCVRIASYYYQTVHYHHFCLPIVRVGFHSTMHATCVSSGLHSFLFSHQFLNHRTLSDAADLLFDGRHCEFAADGGRAVGQFGTRRVWTARFRGRTHVRAMTICSGSSLPGLFVLLRYRCFCYHLCCVVYFPFLNVLLLLCFHCISVSRMHVLPITHQGSVVGASQGERRRHR
jgi:hypothetical protein